MIKDRSRKGKFFIAYIPSVSPSLGFLSARPFLPITSSRIMVDFPYSSQTLAQHLISFSGKTRCKDAVVSNGSGFPQFEREILKICVG